LHNYVVDDQPADELVAFLEGAAAAGEVGRFGIATGIENVLRGLQFKPRLCDVLQFENSVVKQNIGRLPIGAAANRVVVTHGAVGQSYREVSAFLGAHRDKAKEWSEKIGADCSQPSTSSALLLNYAVEANPGGLVLFSSMKPETVARNAKAVFEPEFFSAQIASFAQLVQQELDPLFQST
jgi:hypothetical protein